MIQRAAHRIPRDPATDYRRLISTLASRAARMGSRDPEAAAQEALRRSLENPKSQDAVKYYLGEESAGNAAAPEWRLEQLLAWLHGVLQFVVREEQQRARFRHEVSVIAISEPADGSPDTLRKLLEMETRTIVSDCFAELDQNYRDVLSLRVEGLRYG